MAESNRANGCDKLENSEDDFVPNSQSEEEIDAPLDLVEEVFHEQDEAGSETEEELDAYVAKGKPNKAPNRKRKNCKTKRKTRKSKRAKKGRNTTHASKVRCCDVEEVKKWICTNNFKCCAKKCLSKLKEHQDDAVNAVAELRHRRFAGQ